MSILTVLGAASAAFFAMATEAAAPWERLPVVTVQLSDLPGMCLTVRPDGIAENRACAGTPDQQFRAPGPDGGVLRHGSLCMSALDEGNYPELRAVTCGTGGDHYWIVDHKGRLANNVGRCLALMGGASREGGTVYGARCDETSQTWRSIRASEVWDSRPEAHILVGEACLAWQEGGNFLKAEDCTTATYAAFSYAVNRPTQIRMRSACLRATMDGAPLSLGDCHDEPGQMWVIADGHLMNAGGQCTWPDTEGALRARACPAGVGPFSFPDAP